MRSSLARPVSILLFWGLTFGAVFAKAESSGSQSPAVPESQVDSGPKFTTFNGIEVPPMKELNGEQFQQEVKDGYWYDDIIEPPTSDYSNLY